MSKYRLYGGPLDGGVTEAFSNLTVGYIVDARNVSSIEQYEYRADRRLHFIGSKPLPVPLDPDAVDKLMERYDG